MNKNLKKLASSFITGQAFNIQWKDKYTDEVFQLDLTYIIAIEPKCIYVKSIFNQETKRIEFHQILFLSEIKEYKESKKWLTLLLNRRKLDFHTENNDRFVNSVINRVDADGLIWINTRKTPRADFVLKNFNEDEIVIDKVK